MYYTHIGSLTSPLPGTSCEYSYLTAEETELEHQVAIGAGSQTRRPAPESVPLSSTVDCLSV